MPILKCKMCGGDLDVTEGASVCQCGYCGTSQTVPSADDKKKLRMFERADSLRRSCEFDAALRLYEGIIADFPEEAEAHWGLVLCRYDIEYVDDPASGKKIPTCHRASFESVLECDGYRQAVVHADAVARRVYESEATELERIRAQIAGMVATSDSYDIFICYKESDGDGGRTEDSVIGQEIYDALSERGLRVFFSRISLEDKLGNEYEPIIFSALHSARIMLVLGTKKKYFNEVWVKNEWLRFLKLIEQGERKTIVPCYKYLSPEELPKKLARLQAQDLGKLGYLQDLVHGVTKIVGVRQERASTISPVAAGPVACGASALSQRGNMALEDGEFEKADSFFERALDADPSDGYAYLGKFLAARRIASLDALKNDIVAYEGDRNFQRAMQFASPELIRVLAAAIEINDVNVAAAKKAEELARRKEQEARRRRRELAEAKRKYEAACIAVEAAIQEELAPLVNAIMERHEPEIATIREQIGALESSVMQERVQLQMEISQLKRQRASLPLFDVPRRREIDTRIGWADERVRALDSTDEAREGHRTRLNEALAKRDSEISATENSVRKRHPLPTLAEFAATVA